MKYIRAITITLLGVATLAATSLKAGLIKADTTQFGQNSLTVDTGTGLAWLNLALSCDLSYSQMVSAMQPGQLFAGYRYATADEVVSLFNSAGFSPGFIPETDDSYQNVAALISLMGATDANALLGISGSLTETPSGAIAYTCFVSQSFFNTSHGYNVTSPGEFEGASGYGLDTHYPTVGNWLVAVPEPTTYGLWAATGVLALLRARRK